MVRGYVPGRPRPVYLPDFVITLIRTPFLPPRFASFYVPLDFNKLDLRNYLRNVYNIEVLRIRSTVEQQKVTRELPNRYGYGQWRRPISKKKMTVEMLEPFVWPEPPEDQSAWEKDQFYSQYKYSRDLQESRQPSASAKPVKKEKETFEQQAKDFVEGKETWKPTWQTLGLRYDRPSLAKFAVKQPEETKGQTDLTTKGSEELTEDNGKPKP